MRTFSEVYRERTKLRKKVRIMRSALLDIAAEPCSYGAHESEFKDQLDEDCPGAECWAKKALRDARRVK